MLAGAFALIFAAPDLDSRWLEAGWVLLFFVLAASAYAFFQVPYVAMPAEISLRPASPNRSAIASAAGALLAASPCAPSALRYA